LLLLHPIMPFVTEELGRALARVETITLGPWPEPHPDHLDPDAEAEMAVLQEAVGAIRRYRAEHQVPPSRRPELTVVPADAAQAKLFAEQADSLAALARLAAVQVAGPGARGWSVELTGPPAGEATARLLAAGAELYLPLAGLLDLDEERARLARERERLAGELARAEGKLANRAFVDKAPAAVVAKAAARRDEVAAAIAKVQAQLAELGG
jgi:valyl-tRNA synthetase